MFPLDEADAGGVHAVLVIASLTRNNVSSPLSSSQPPAKRATGQKIENRITLFATASNPPARVQHLQPMSPLSEKRRLDTPVAVKAMAAKLARLVYRMLRYGMK
jgi:hypothetical protein